jgi:hypothetical protein
VGKLHSQDCFALCNSEAERKARSPKVLSFKGECSEQTYYTTYGKGDNISSLSPMGPDL